LRLFSTLVAREREPLLPSFGRRRHMVVVRTLRRSEKVVSVGRVTAVAEAKLPRI
jgi:hypothetical protein